MNNSIQDNLMQENDTGYTDEELNMLAEGEPAIDLEEIAESQYELSDDYMAEELLDKPGLYIIKEPTKLKVPETYINKDLADQIRGLRSDKKREKGDYL